MKVGTDGVLLGASVDCSNCTNILDIGTGTGLVAIMLAQRCDAAIDGIEIVKDAVSLAKENVNDCKWKNQINIIHNDFITYNPKYKYDLIVSNPPYFSTDIISPNKNRGIARHNFKLLPTDILKKTSKILTADGRLVVIYPIKEAEIFKNIAIKFGFNVTDELYVKPNLEKDPVRLIRTYSKYKKELVTKSISIETKKRHEYTCEYVNLTHEYYLYVDNPASCIK